MLTEPPIRAYPQERVGLSIVEWHRVPFRERVVDLLADLMLNADDRPERLRRRSSTSTFCERVPKHVLAPRSFRSVVDEGFYRGCPRGTRRRWRPPTSGR